MECNIDTLPEDLDRRRCIFHAASVQVQTRRSTQRPLCSLDC